VDAGIELKGAVSPLTVLRLHTDDLGIIESELFQRVERAPQLLLNAPIVVDFAAAGANIDLERLVAALRRCQVVPVAAANLPIELCARAARAGLGTIPLTMKRRPTEPAPEPVAVAVAPPEPEPVAVPEPAPVAAPEATTVHAVVRGGQVIYAQRSDLVVMDAVNACAQVIADGHIHIYGALRGRAP
jgi:septum site-determining protein MinC